MSSTIQNSSNDTALGRHIVVLNSSLVERRHAGDYHDPHIEKHASGGVIPFNEDSIILRRGIMRQYPTMKFFRGSAKAFAASCVNESDLLEEIIHSAVLNYTKEIFIVANPGRHHHIAHWMTAIGIQQRSTENQGFLTSHGRYVDREEGLAIATAANQLIRKTHPLTKLFSEDVWESETT